MNTKEINLAAKDHSKKINAIGMGEYNIDSRIIL